MNVFNEIPLKNPELQNQTELTEVNEEYLKFVLEEPKFLLIHKIFQFLSFIVFLGPLKLTICFVSALLWLIAIHSLPLFEGLFLTAKSYKLFCYKLLKKILRVFLFGAGFVRIEINGKISNGTRVVVSNHLSFFDYLIYLYSLPVTLMMNNTSPGPERIFIGTVLDVFYMKKIKHVTAAEQFANLTSDPSFLPILDFPERRPTIGNALLSFDTRSFNTDYSIQPSAIRYYLGFTAPGFNSIYSKDEPTFGEFVRILACPFIMCKVTVLNPISRKGDENFKLADKALIAQLAIANELGVLAIQQNSSSKRKKQ